MSDPATPAAPSLALRFAQTIEGLCQTIAARAGRQRALAPLVLLLWPRLRRMDARFQALVARLRAGLASPARRRRSPRPASADAASRPPTPRPPQRLPTGFAWLVALMQETAVYGVFLESLLADPEMPALLAAEPRLGRILRPLCRMLAVRPTVEMAPETRRVLAPRAAASRSAPRSRRSPPPAPRAAARSSPRSYPHSPPHSPPHLPAYSPWPPARAPGSTGIRQAAATPGPRAARFAKA